MSTELLHVTLAIDFSDEIVEMLRQVSPKLIIERHFPEVADEVWERTDILYTTGRLIPEPHQAPHLKWVQLNSAGVEHVSHKPIIQTTDIALTSASGIHAVPMAEWAMGMMLSWEYQFPLMYRHQQQKHWHPKRGQVFSPRHLRGQTVGIVGYGSIGRELARLAQAMGMVVLATKRNAKHPEDRRSYVEAGTGDPAGDIPERIYPPEAVATMARDCDYLVLITPLTEQTRHMINDTVFEAMRESAVLVNMARGGVVDENALIAALRGHKIAGALLDVFSEEPLPAGSPLWEMDNVIISPHVSGNSRRYHERAAALFAENLQRYLERGELLNLYNRQRGY